MYFKIMLKLSFFLYCEDKKKKNFRIIQVYDITHVDDRDLGAGVWF